MPLSGLALRVYDILRARLPSKADVRISYSDLAGMLGISERDPALATALGEIVTACREAKPKNLPALSALVVRRDNGHLTSPGSGYYPLAHPADAHDDAKAQVAWAEELRKVQRENYPPAL